jgi:hypothetical protein
LKQAGGTVELRIPCDPPERVIRQLALGGAMPVRAHLLLPLASAPGLWLVAALVAVAIGATIAGALVSRAAPVVAAANTPSAEVVPFDPVAPAEASPKSADDAPSPPRDDDPVDSSRSVGS